MNPLTSSQSSESGVPILAEQDTAAATTANLTRDCPSESAVPRGRGPGLLTAACYTLGTFTLLGYLGSSSLLCELLSHFKLQYAVCLSILGLILLTRRRWVSLAIAICLAGINVAEILPLYNRDAAPMPTGDPLKLLCANVLFSNPDADPFIALIRQEDPDIIGILEYSDAWRESMAAIKEDYPYFTERTHEDPFGIACFSRVPLEDLQITFLGPEATPSITARFTWESQECIIIVTHPVPPSRRDWFKQRNLQLEHIAAAVNRYDRPTIVLGDLNVTPYSPVYKKFVKRAGLRNSRSGFGLLSTWPTPAYFSSIDAGIAAAAFRIPIDHILTSEEWKVLDCRRGPSIGSDHFPLQAELSLSKPLASPQKKEP